MLGGGSTDHWAGPAVRREPAKTEDGLRTNRLLVQRLQKDATVDATLSDPVGESARLAVGALLAGLNYGLGVAAFEIDHGDGEVRCRAGLSFAGIELTAPMVRSLAAAAVVGLDTYRPAIEAVADGAEPLAALADAGG